MHSKRLMFLMMALALIVVVGFGGGWQLNEHGARAMGFGGAWASRALDLSAMYSNAAGLTNLKGIQVMAGGTIIMPSSKFKGPGSATTVSEMESQTFFLPNLYGSYQINDKLVVGLGIYAPFGLGTKWADNWVGRSLSINSEIQIISINPSVAYKINDKFSVGGGISVLMGSVNMTYKPLAALGNEGLIELDADANTAISFNVGVLYQFNDKLSVGASYRTLADVEFAGKMTATNMGTFQTFFPGGDGSATLPMPSNLQVGVSYQVIPKLVVAFDYQMVGWSAYDKLTITVPNGPAVPNIPAYGPLAGRILQTSTTQAQGWEDGNMFRFGAEYTLNEKFMFRGGLVYDMVPQPAEKMEPRLPDWTKTDLTLGVGYNVNEKITVDAAYMMILSTERFAKHPTFPGMYTSSANLFALDVSYAF